jgi:hypothetical protein
MASLGADYSKVSAQRDHFSSRMCNASFDESKNAVDNSTPESCIYYANSFLHPLKDCSDGKWRYNLRIILLEIPLAVYRFHFLSVRQERRIPPSSLSTTAALEGMRRTSFVTLVVARKDGQGAVPSVLVSCRAFSPILGGVSFSEHWCAVCAGDTAALRVFFLLAFQGPSGALVNKRSLSDCKIKVRIH